MSEIASCELIIEAVPERIDVKRELFADLSRICRPQTVLATNTSSIPVTQIAAATAHPECVVGMHFFNPAPAMKLVEVVSGIATGTRARRVARATAEAMGKRVIETDDTPGFLVNRCGRPYFSEALRMLQERVATHERIDQICRVGGGFPMGPFELMDLVGIDTNLAVAESFAALSFGEPRWKPNPLQARMVAAGRLGKKSGVGWYSYSSDRRGGRTNTSLSELEEGIVTPGRVLHRMHCCIVNEALFALGEGVGSAQEIDAGVTLGLNWPVGSIELGRQIGLQHVLETMDELYRFYGEERYRAAPAMRAWRTRSELA